MRVKGILALATVGLVAVAGVTLFTGIGPRAYGQPASNGFDENYSFSSLNVKARAVNEIGGTANINSLVDEVFSTFRVDVTADVKARIANSENLYQQNQRDGVEEVKVVQAINGLQLYFNTPEFSKTDLYEVRKIRQDLQLYAPQFVGHGRLSEQNAVGNIRQTIVEKMSPAEAVFVTIALIYQKGTNGNYQVTFAERNARWADAHTKEIGQSLEADPTRAGQLMTAVNAKLATMSLPDVAAVPNTALNILGIEQ